MDRQTDGQTELRWLRRAIAVPAVERKNCCCWVFLQVKYLYLSSIQQHRCTKR